MQTFKRIIWFFANPKLLLCLGIAWMITNGWSYVFLALGTALGIGWMQAVGGAYLGLLWLPFTPEKILTAAIAILLLKLFFPNDTKTLLVLENMFKKAKESMRRKKPAESVDTEEKTDGTTDDEQ